MRAGQEHHSINNFRAIRCSARGLGQASTSSLSNSVQQATRSGEHMPLHVPAVIRLLSFLSFTWNGCAAAFEADVVVMSAQ